MKLALSLLAVTLLLMSCGTDEINIRVMNLSSFEVENLDYQGIQTTGSLQPGEVTPYMMFEEAYTSPTSLAMTIEGEELRYLLIDRLGVSELESGNYTYLLYATNHGENQIFGGGSVFDDGILSDFNPVSENCIPQEISDCNSQSDKANIRVKNSTAFDFCNVVVDITNQNRVIYGDLPSGETSCYLSFNSARQYPFKCTFLLGDEEYLIENPTFHERLDDLEAGLYTYNISIIRPQSKFGDIQMSID